ncbi:hypothetical protein [uncultured Shimia sp.]|uniref:hypothetical protein n=1 Tax=uncultured Shimia sp. TaxID=573152 RepID=UPI002606B96B|nr:hypothetical protein [uncultured Shimia sp.]
MRSVNRIFATLMALPVALWLMCLIAVFFIRFVFSCETNDGLVQACIVLGHDIGQGAVSLMIFAAWGQLMIVPWLLAVGLCWGLFALISRQRTPKA